jgi:hypothetical protein
MTCHTSFFLFWKKKSTQFRKYMHPPQQRSNLRPQQLYTRKPSQPALKHVGLVVLIQRPNRTKLSLISGKQFLTSNGDGSRLGEMEGAKIPAYRLQTIKPGRKTYFKAVIDGWLGQSGSFTTAGECRISKPGNMASFQQEFEVNHNIQRLIKQ